MYVRATGRSRKVAATVIMRLILSDRISTDGRHREPGCAGLANFYRTMERRMINN